MNSSGKQKAQSKLKDRGNRSHNPDSQILALVKLIARQAAEEDFKTDEKRINQKVKGGKP